MTKHYVGIDLGGTNIRAAVASGRTSYDHHVAHRTPSADGPEAVCDAMAHAVREAAGGEKLGGVAIGIPGPLNSETGVVYAAPHLSGWKDVPVIQMMQDRLSCPVAIHNDANLAGYGEWKAGAGVGSSSMVFMTVSTGVGGGIILDGKMWSGATGTAGEIGHTPLGPDEPPCMQGHKGCLEGTASGTAIARRAREIVQAGTKTILSKTPLDEITAETVENAAREGDAVSIDLYKHAGRAIGRLLGGLINYINPELIVIGGGMIHAKELLLTPLMNAISEMAFAYPLEHTKIEVAALGTDAGLVGAVSWAVEEFGADAFSVTAQH